MANRKMWKCDFKDCEEIAQWYRVCKGKLVKLCTKHETQLAKQHYGRRVDFSELDEDDIHYLQEKESRFEYFKKVPFKIDWKIKEKIHYIDVKDRKTGEWRSFQIADDNWNREGSHKILEDLENGMFFSKPSIDEFVEILKKVITKSD
jgi:hypothetical protein